MSSLFDDTDDDLSHRTRRTEPPEYAEDHAPGRQTAPHDREVTLNTGMVLAIFFALALVCAVFFGFGYSIGHKSGMTAAAATSASSDAAASSDDTTAAPSGTKPVPGSPVTASNSATASQRAEGQANTAASTPTTTPRIPVLPVEPTSQPPAADASKPAPIVRIPVVSTATSPPNTASNPTDSTVASYVQVAAVSHQEDAQELVAALQRRGYRVILRSEPADHLIHVQIGPFPSKKDAEPMRQRLLADGYNAFIK